MYWLSDHRMLKQQLNGFPGEESLDIATQVYNNRINCDLYKIFRALC